MKDVRLEKEAVLHCHREAGSKFTLAAIFNERNSCYDIGVSILNKHDKNFRKDMGKRIALGRASRRPILHITKESVEKAGDVIYCLKQIEADIRKNNLRYVYDALKSVLED